MRMGKAERWVGLFERVQCLHASLFEIADVARGDDETVFESRSRNHCIQQRHHRSLSPKLHYQSGPSTTYRSVPGKALDCFNYSFKPLLEFVPLAAAGQREDTNTQFAKNDRVDNQVCLVRCEPFNNPGVRRLFRWLAQYVCIYKERHPSNGALMSFVVSVRSSGWNQSLVGQASNNFTRPLLLGRSFRLRRYSPRSSRSISNSCPGLTSSSRRISAGRMICPFVETVVLILGKILSYQPTVNRRDLHVPGVGPSDFGQGGHDAGF